ncbi:GtrA family protein [Rhizobium sp. BR 317]|uniref:GtrA family protein n=1 Tax=Rhizobium sp. BR 317 TaxID=3040015 RepID=UPI0039BF5A41
MLLGQLSRYAAVGIINTAIGLSVIYTAMFIGWGDISSNLVGYAIGFVISFCANGAWTFRSRLSGRKAAKYAVLMTLAYLLNVTVMIASRDLLDIDRYISQLVGVMAYTAFGFVGSRVYVFK